jgi:DNA invertase Pin-like site-specific DNA recombinase
MDKAAVYLRVSTADQRMDSQRAEMVSICRSRGFEPVMYEDKISGAKFSREGLDAMMAAIRSGQIKAVFCFKLDRLGRSLPHLAQIVGEMDRYGCGLVVPSQGIDTVGRDNPAARLQLNVLMAVAEFERSIIRERTNAGLAAARARGVIGGRPKGSRKFDRVCKAVREADGKVRAVELAGKLGVSRAMIYRAIAAVKKDTD